MIDLPDLVIDPDTLHERFAADVPIAAHLDELRTDIRTASDDTAELLARGDLVELLRIAGTLDEALDEANAAVDRSDLVGTAAQQHTARLRLATVHQWRGEYAESTLLCTELLAAASQFGPVIDAFTHQHAGLNDYDQGHFDDAAQHFAYALEIRDRLELPDEQRASSRTALTAARRHLDGGHS